MRNHRVTQELAIGGVALPSFGLALNLVGWLVTDSNYMQAASMGLAALGVALSIAATWRTGSRLPVLSIAIGALAAFMAVVHLALAVLGA